MLRKLLTLLLTFSLITSYLPAFAPISRAEDVPPADIYAPLGSVLLNNGDAYSLENLLTIQLEGYHNHIDEVVDNGQLYYRVGNSSDLSLLEYEMFVPESDSKLTIESQFEQGYGNYSIYFQLKDEFDNESEVYFDSIDYLQYYISGGIAIDDGKSFEGDHGEEVVDENVEISISGKGNNKLQSYAVELVDNFENSVWIDFADPDFEVNTKVNFQLEKRTGIQSVFVKLKDEFGNTSDTYSYSVYLNYHDIKPSVESNLDKILFGGESEVYISLNNTGSDLSYHNSLRINLPKGFSYIEIPKGEDEELSKDYVLPTFVGFDEHNNQYIEYVGIADLLPGESISVDFIVKAGGRKAGYKLGDKVNIDVLAYSYKKGDFEHPIEVIETIESEMVPYFVYVNTIRGGQLVGDEQANSIKIQNNPEIPTIENDENGQIPFSLQYAISKSLELENESIEYVNYKGEDEDIEFRTVENESDRILEWLFHGQLGVNYYAKPLQILFDTIIPKQDSDGSFVEHNQVVEQNLQTTGYYSNYSKTDDRYEEVEFSLDWSGGAQAKYFRVRKYANNKVVNPEDRVIYRIQIETSVDYKLNTIELTDILPDGVRFDGNVEYQEGNLVELISSDINEADGKQHLMWRINEGIGMSAGSVFEFEYSAIVGTHYDILAVEDDARLRTHDQLKSNLSLNTEWEDTDSANARIGINTDSAGVALALPAVEYDLSSFINDDPTEISSDVVDVRVGDNVVIKASIVFPSSTPTEKFVTQFYLPQGSELISGFEVEHSGIFEHAPIVQTGMYGGYALDLGRVEPGSRITITYTINFEDIPAFKSGVQTRNLFRADYTDINSNKKSHADEIGFRIVEPELQITKKVMSGYLARGEGVEIQVQIKNIGLANAYGVGLEDELPENSEIVDGSYSISNGVDLELVERVFKSGKFDIAKNGTVTLLYKVLLDDNLLYADSLKSQTTTSTYRSRSESDTLPFRTYNSKIAIHNWKSKEPLLSTRIFREGFEGSENIPLGREDNAKIVAIVENVGGAPVYNVEATLNYADLLNLNSNIVFTCTANNGILEQLSVNIGESNLNVDQLNPSGKISCEANVLSPMDINFGQEFSINIGANGQDKLGLPIRPDGSDRTSNDYDNDDQDSRKVVITKLDNSNPHAVISISSFGNHIEYTNQSSVNVGYSAEDEADYETIQSHIVGARFSNDGVNWNAISELPLLDNLDLWELEGEWNSWDGSLYEVISSLEHDGRFEYYMEVVDLYGNKSIINSFVIRDTIAPDNGVVSISPIGGDMTNPQLTWVVDNYVNISFEDSQLNIPSGIASYQFSFDNEDWSEWIEYSQPVSTVEYTIAPEHDMQSFQVWVRVVDGAGNVSSEFSDSIKYIEEDRIPPVGTIEFTNANSNILAVNNISGLKIKYTASDTGSQEIQRIKNVRFSTDGFNWHTISSLPTEECVGSSEICNIWDGSELSLDYSDLNRTMYEGRLYEYMEVRDFAGNISIIKNSFVFDKTAPGLNGDFWIGRTEYDWSNPTYTDKYSNYLVYEVFDNFVPSDNPEIVLTGEGVSGIAKVRFSIDNKTFSPWVEYSGLGLGSYLQKWVKYYYDVPWMGYMQVMDGAGNIGTYTYSDSILYLPTKFLTPTISVKINNNEAITSSPIVALKVAKQVTSPDFELSKIRFKYCHTSCKETDIWSEWKDYSDSIIDVVKSPDISGNKIIYVQGMNTEGYLSNEAYDSIVYDREGPTVLSHTVQSTQSDKYGLTFQVLDKTSDGSTGVGIKSYSFQMSGGEWSDWIAPYNSRSNIWFWKSVPDEAVTTGAIRFQDMYGYIGNIYEFEIIDRGLTDSENADNDESGSEALDGKILINDGAIFTNSREVKVYLEANENFQGNTRQQPEYYYLSEFPNGFDETNKHSYSGPITQDFTLSEGFGLKKIRVRFKIDDVPSATGFDEIIYAPRYLVNYSNINFVNDANQVIDKPTEVLAGSDLNIRLDLDNYGSETWRVNDELSNSTPVNLSYHWYRIENGNPVQFEWNGTRSSLPHNVGYNQGIDGTNMHIDVPIMAGEYFLKLDMVHEGVTWFSEVSNTMPEFVFTVMENPELPILTDEEEGRILGEYVGEFGIGDSTCNEVFIDICGSTFIKYIKNLRSDNVINGDDQYDTNPQTFNPNSGMQRGQLAEWIVKGFNFTINTSGTKFIDANTYAKTPYMDYIQTLKNLGITNGFSDGTYRPNINITRAELATLLVRSMAKKGMVLDYSLWHNFDDMYNSSHEPYVAIITSTVVNGERIMSGFRTTYFGGAEIATRGQTSKALDLSRQFVPKEGVGTIVNIQGVNLYKEPSVLSAVVGKVPYTDSVNIIQQKLVAGEWWLYIKSSSGLQGWTKSDNVFIPTGYEFPIIEEYQLFENAHMCNDTEIAIYEAPNWDSRQIKLLAKNTNMNVIEIDGDWRKVVLTGRVSGTGWMHKAYICEGYSDGPEYFGLLGFSKPYDPNSTLESLFGPREGGFHYATDYGMACGSPIYSIHDGVVVGMFDGGVVEGNNSTPETPVNYLIIEHDNGYISSYFHLSTVEVGMGDRVYKGQFIGMSGNTGYVRGNPDHPLEQQGCHLHFEIREMKNDPTDVWEYLFARNPIEVFQQTITPALKQLIEDLKERFFGVDITDEEIINNVEFGVGNVPDVCLNPYNNQSKLTDDEEDGEENEVETLNSKITFSKNSSNWISQKTIIIEDETYVAPPEITGVKITKDGLYATIYGYGTPRSKDVDIQVYNYELTDCDLIVSCSPITMTYQTKQPVTESRILLYRGEDKEFIGWTDQVYADGSWHITVSLENANVGINSLIYAKSEIYVDFDYSLPMYPWFSRNVEFNLKKIDEGDGVKSDYGPATYLYSSSACDFTPPENTDCRNQGSPFTDVCPSSRYYKSIVGLTGFDTNLDGVIGEGEVVISGFSDESFRPDMKVTRGQMAKFIVNGYNLDVSTECGDFPDVDELNVFYEYIMALKCNGIVNGYGDGTYKPDEYVTRSQIAKIIVSAMEEKYHTNFSTIGFSSSIDFKDLENSTLPKRDIGLLSNFKKDGEYISEWKGENFDGNITINRAELSRLIYMTKPIILDVPYINQWTDYDGTNWTPPGGGYMCGAASSVMALGYLGKLESSDLTSLRKNMNEDNEQGIAGICSGNIAVNGSFTAGGAFYITSNTHCDQSYSNGIPTYLHHSSANWEFLSGIEYKLVEEEIERGDDKGVLTFAEYIQSINQRSPVLMSLTVIEHINLGIGYGVDDMIIVNDSYQSLSLYEKYNYSHNGKGALYKFLGNEINDSYPVQYSISIKH